MTKSLATQFLRSLQRNPEQPLPGNCLLFPQLSTKSQRKQISKCYSWNARSPRMLFQLFLNGDVVSKPERWCLWSGICSGTLSAVVKKIHLGCQELQWKALKAQLLITKGNAKIVAINLYWGLKHKGMAGGSCADCWERKPLFSGVNCPHGWLCLGMGLLCSWSYCQIKCHSQNQPFREWLQRNCKT